MAEIIEVLEDFGDNAKSLFKNKKFWLVAGGVGVVALVAGYLKNKETGGEMIPYEAVGYAGYPTVGGASSSGEVSSDVTYFEQLLGEIQAEHGSSVSDLQAEFDASVVEMESNITTLTNRLVTAEETTKKQTFEMEKQNAISQMRANSELYNALSTPADASTREALHAENKAIAEKYGFTFDPNSGNWFDGNTVVYTTAHQQAAVARKSSSTSKTTAVNYVTNAANTAAKVAEAAKFDPNKDYTTAIREAKSSGASEAVINQLYAERNAKIAANPDLEKYRNDV